MQMLRHAPVPAKVKRGLARKVVRANRARVVERGDVVRVRGLVGQRGLEGRVDGDGQRVGLPRPQRTLDGEAELPACSKCTANAQCV